MEKISGTFEISPEVITLSLEDGRRFTIVFNEKHLVIHDVSWNNYYTEGSKLLTREAILALQHSDIDIGPTAIPSVMKFMDITPIPPTIAP